MKKKEEEISKSKSKRIYGFYRNIKTFVSLGGTTKGTLAFFYESSISFYNLNSKRDPLEFATEN